MQNRIHQQSTISSVHSSRILERERERERERGGGGGGAEAMYLNTQNIQYFIDQLLV